MRIIINICITIVFFSGMQCYGQDNICSDLLKHGIYDHFRETGDSSSYSRTQKELCESYNELQKDITRGSAKASYSLFGGKASFSREQLESVAKQMCSHDFSESSAKNMIEKASSMINPSAVQAYRECIANSAVGLKSKTEYTQDDIGVKNITLTLYYAPDKGMSETPVFKGIIMSPKDSFECSGDLCDYKKGKRISTSAHTTTFTRKIASDPFEEQGRKLYASAGSITVSTSAGAIIRQVTPIYAPPPAEIERRLTEAEMRLNQLGKIICVKTEKPFNSKAGDHRITFSESDCGGKLPDKSYTGVLKSLNVCGGASSWQVNDGGSVYFWSDNGVCGHYTVEALYIKVP